MSSPVIRVENLSKLYRLGEVGTGSLAHDINRWWHRVRGKEDPYVQVGQINDRTKKAESDWVWALKDINLEVKQGEVLGIIGRNGAGKSTLLKILSRIMAPTTGNVKVKGRIASLLEVGTGFHPDLSGRENIYLNGAILGMRRHEITRKLDEIVDFAGCAAYLDTPVKRYSSGMTVRLAFAVSAHLDAEIMVIDEVLAVGDGEFQKKCLGKMNDVAGMGRTLLFVSHNMGMISSLCQRTILLEEGQMIEDTSTSEGVLAYYTRGKATPHQVSFERDQRAVTGMGATLLAGTIEDSTGHPVPEVDIRLPFQVRMRYRLDREAGGPPLPNFHFTDSTGSYVFVTSPSGNACETTPGVYDAVCQVPGNLMNNGTYFVGLALTFLHQGVDVAFYEKDALCVNIIDPLDETLDHDRHGYSGHIPGVVRPRLEWSTAKIL